jgi:hypothetical protein
MIHTTFSENGRLLSYLTLENDADYLGLPENLVLYGGRLENCYLDIITNTIIDQQDFIPPISGPINFGIRKEEDILMVNGEVYEPRGETILEFSEPGEYEIFISFLEYKENTFTVIVL